jgi:hypothetical protein
MFGKADNGGAVEGREGRSPSTGRPVGIYCRSISMPPTNSAITL